MSGVPILTNVVSGWRLYVEIAWGADLTVDPMFWSWFDVTTDVLVANNGGVAITVGRANEAKVAQPATCSLRLKNQTGIYTPTNPASTHYPYVRLGTPVRVSISIDGGLTTNVRFQGEAAAWQPGWDAQGKFAYVGLTASGITRRLGSGSKPIRSTLTRSVLATTSPALRQYWPLEDGAQATSALSAVGGPAMTTLGQVQFGTFNPSTATLTFAQGVVYGTDLLPQLNTGAQLSSSFSAGSASSWTVQFTNYADVFTAAPVTVAVLEWHCAGSTYPLWQLISDSDPAHIGVDATRVVAFNAAGVGTTVCSLPGIFVLSEMRVDAAQSGGNISVSMKVINSQGEAFTASGTLSTATLAGVNAFVVNPNETSISADFSVGHIRLWDGNTAPDFQTSLTATSAWTSYNGETATDRLTRLCDEEGVTLDLNGSSNITMGPQGIDTFMNLLRECESTDLGYLVDGLGPGLTYFAREQAYSRAAGLTINATAGQVPALGPQPILDDQRITNRVTVTRLNGSVGYVAEDTDGTVGSAAVGVHDDRRVVNVQYESQLADIAAWLVHVGTVDDMRYPQVPLDLTAAPELASLWLGVIPTDRIDETNLSSQLTQFPPADVSLLVEGWAETINSRRWSAAVNCSNYRPWQVFEIADSQLGRIQAGSSTLHTSYSAGVASISVDTASGPLWSTTSAPFDVLIRGWKVHVTAVSGSSSPQTFTVTATPAALVVGDSVSLWRSGVIAL